MKRMNSKDEDEDEEYEGKRRRDTAKTPATKSIRSKEENDNSGGENQSDKNEFDSTENDKPKKPRVIPDSAKVTVLSNMVLSPKLKMSQIQSLLQNVEFQPVQEPEARRHLFEPEAPSDEPITDISQVVDYESYLKYFSKENVESNETENNAAELNDANSGIENLLEIETPQVKLENNSNQEFGSSAEGNDDNEVQYFIPKELLEEIMICDDGELPNLFKLLPENNQTLQQRYDNPAEHLEDLCSLIESSNMELDNTNNSDPVDPTNENEEDCSNAFPFQYLWGLAHGCESDDINNVTPLHDDINEDISPETNTDLDFWSEYGNTASVENDELSINEYSRALDADIDFNPENLISLEEESDDEMDVSEFLSVSLFYSTPEREFD